MIFFEFIVTAIVELIIEGIILNLFKLIRKLGILVLLIITFSQSSFKELDQEYYKDSSKPYFAALLIIAGIIYFFVK